VLSVSRMSSCPISLARVTDSNAPRDHPASEGMTHFVEAHTVDPRAFHRRLEPPAGDVRWPRANGTQESGSDSGSDFINEHCLLLTSAAGRNAPDHQGLTNPALLRPHFIQSCHAGGRGFESRRPPPRRGRP
jgi:hypothetical protein